MTQYPVIHLTKHQPGPGEKSTRFRVIEACSFNHLGNVYEIPVDFLTDFSSVPRLLWPVIPPHGLATVPSIKHDYLYDYRIGEEELGAEAARLAADVAFLGDLLLVGVNTEQAFSMYKAVRKYGEKYWIN